MYKNLILFISLLFTLVLVSACSPEIPYLNERGSFHGRSYSILYQSSISLQQEIDEELERSNNILNAYNPHAVISKINRNEPVEVDDYFIEIFNQAYDISERTGGMFDITCFPLVSFWRSSFTKSNNVAPHLVDSIKEFVGYKKVKIVNHRVVKEDPRIQITLSAVAKGYTCDKIAELMNERGIANYMIDLGGVVVAKGVDDHGNLWQSAIRKPIETDDNRTISIEEIVQIQNDRGVSTSGDFNDYYTKDGKKFAYTINPITGYPTEQNILSCTIVGVNGVTADGFSTAFTALGSLEAVEINRLVPEIEFFMIYTNEAGEYKTEYSEGMLKYLLKRKEKKKRSFFN